METLPTCARAGMRRKLLMTTILAGLTLGGASEAFAQTATTATSGGPVTLPTVEVDAAFGGAGPAQDPYNTTYELKDTTTGTKTDTPVMDTPLNVQAVSQQVLRDQQAITIDQALQNVSGVNIPAGSVSGFGTPSGRITIRGFPVTTIYRDGFRIDTSQQQSDFLGFTQLTNVASVEVLKGPGAVLYGLSEPGGVVNIVTKEPLNAPYTSVQQQIGSFANYRTTLDTTGPVTDDKSVLYRFNMSYQSNGAPFGYPIDFVHSQNFFLAPVVKWNVDEATWVKLEGEFAQNRADSFFQDAPALNGTFISVPRNVNYAEPSPELQRWFFTALTWSHRFDNDWSIKQQISYNRVEVTDTLTFINGTADTPTGPVFVRSNQLLSQPQSTYATNVDITGHIDTFGAKHTLLVGGDVYKIFGNYVFVDNYASSQIDLFFPVHPGTPLNGFPYNSAQTFDQLTAGLYVQDQIELPYRFFLMAGARYQDINQNGVAGATLATLPPAGPALVAQAVTPRFGLLWRPQEWLSFYGNYTESFGANTGLLYNGPTQSGIPAPPTSAQSWEAGLKLEFFDGRLRATADYFSLLKNNITTPDLIPGQEGFSVLSGQALSKGVEVDVQGQILPGWDLIATYTNQDVRVTSGTGGLDGLQSEGQPFAGVPQNLASLWTTYAFQDETFKGLKIGGGYIYHGSQPFVDLISFFPSTIALETLPSYGTVNLMGAYSFKISDTKLTAQLNITNLFNKFYTADAIIFPVSTTSGYTNGRRAYGAPFNALGSLRAEF